MKKINYKNAEKSLNALTHSLTVGYIVAIIVINLFGKMFSDFDIYSDSLVAQQMWEQKTLFPDNWVFGNQFYIAATPVLSALIYGIVGNRALALGIASCLMLVFAIIAFTKCFLHQSNKSGFYCGILCLCGGAIVSTGAATELDGLQLFFTMASFYSSYLIDIILTINIYTKLIKGEKCTPIYILLVLLFNLALGMNSLRQTLVLCLPLLAVETLLLFEEAIKNKKILSILKHNAKRSLFVVLVMVFNVFGIVLIRFINPLSNPVTGKINIPSNFDEILLFFKSSIKAISSYVGLNYFTLPILYWPLGLFSVFFIICVIVSIIMMIRKKDKSPIAIAVYINLISVISVLLTGIFIMRTRDVYYFTWHILVTCCVMYLCNELKDKFKIIFITTLLIGCAVNAFFSFRINPFILIANHKEYINIAQTIEQSEFDCVHILVGSPAYPAAYTNETLYTMLQINNSEDEYPFKFLNCTQSNTIQQYAEGKNSLLLISSYCRQQISNELFAEIEPKLKLKYSFTLSNGQTLNYYEMTEKLIADFQ